MTFEEAKLGIERLLSEYNQKIDRSEITVSYSITYQNEEYDDCDINDKTVRSITGELSVRSNEMLDDDAVVYCIIIDCDKKRTVDENHYSEETDRFAAELDTFISELDGAEDTNAFMRDASETAKAEVEAAMKEFEAKIEKFTKASKIVTGITIGLLALAIVIAIALG